MGLATALHAAAPAELAAALASFRQDPPPGWSYTQTIMAGGKSTVERCDAARPEFARWTLLRKDGRAPNDDENRTYRETRTQRSRAGTAPRLAEQLDPATARLVSQDALRAVYECRLRSADSGDRTAGHLVATITIRRPTGAIERVELASNGAFRPAIGVEITSLRTTLDYDVPSDGRPALPRGVETRLRGAAFWFKSLDADMTITFTDYVRATPLGPRNDDRR
ncbi:MAG: hypothetical protein RIR76_3308 [Verrucomicrobiota bacterium]|jgi:hypothetical protein|nr:hypothetical protein [Opitutaceae bacterium]